MTENSMDKSGFPNKKKSFFTVVLGVGIASMVRAALGRAGILKQTSGLRCWINTGLRLSQAYLKHTILVSRSPGGCRYRKMLIFDISRGENFQTKSDNEIYNISVSFHELRLDLSYTVGNGEYLLQSLLLSYSLLNFWVRKQLWASDWDRTFPVYALLLTA